MPEKSERRGQGDQRGKSVTERNHVLIFIVGRAVHQLYAGAHPPVDGALGQRAQPVEIVVAELVASPDGGGGSQRIEIVNVRSGRWRLCHGCRERKLFPRLRVRFGDFVGTGAVADDVARDWPPVERGSGGQAGLQRFQVGVNVAEQQYAQESPDKVAIIEQREWNHDLVASGVIRIDKEASQTRDYCVAKCASFSRLARSLAAQRTLARDDNRAGHPTFSEATDFR